MQHCSRRVRFQALGPEQLFRFVRGEEIVTANGVRVKIGRPLDWLSITDHAEYLGMADQIRTANPDLLATEYGQRWSNMFKTSKDEGGDCGPARRA